MQKGIIISNISNIYEIEVDNEIYEASARGKLKKEEICPVVGDKVLVEIIDKLNKKAVINKILERENYIKRPKLANITKLILVLSAKMPNPDLLMLDKQLAFAEYLDIEPIIVINKIDLEHVERIKKVYSDIGYKVIETIAKQEVGIEELKGCLQNSVSAFSGNSGVGKSTLINNLFKQNITDEGEISNKNKKGKNTTTSTKLYKLKSGGYIADTPGFSTFNIYEIETKDLYKYFKEFKQYEKECAFVGCTHIKEKECGIKKAYNSKKISESRYRNYIKIYEDLKDKEEHKW